MQHGGSTGSGKAEPGALEDPSKRHQTPHHGHMGAENEGQIQRMQCISNCCMMLLWGQKKLNGKI